MWALSNIAGEGFYDFRDSMIKAGILKEISTQFSRTNKQPSYYKTGMWLIKNIMKKPTPDFDKVYSF